MWSALFLSVSILDARAAGDEPPAPPPPPAAEASPDVLYALGLSLGRSVQTFQLTEEELASVQAGLHDAVVGTPRLNLDDYLGEVRVLASERVAVHAARERERSALFLAQLAAMPGARASSSGLVYVETRTGTGPSPAVSDTVHVKYRGTLRDGTEIDSSQDSVFPLHAVVACWREGLPLMRVGGTAILGCPAELAYGDTGRPPKIPGGAATQYEVELLAIVPQDPPNVRDQERPRRSR